LEAAVVSVILCATFLPLKWLLGPFPWEVGGSRRFTDKRDGQRYKGVKMPDGRTWMAQNLNYQTDSSWCYENSAGNCAKYGRLYAWNAALSACPVGWHLPSRWEWDTLGRAIIDKTGGKTGNKTSNNADSGKDWHGVGEKLKANGSRWDSRYISHFTGSRRGRVYRLFKNRYKVYRFSALPAGNRLSDGSFHNAGEYGGWWTSTEGGVLHAYGRGIYYNDNPVSEDNYYRRIGISVRCVRDD
jgi:uncharacterized protein (TIGR02145 family)